MMNSASNKDLIKQLQEFFIKNNRAPVKRDFKNNWLFCQRFGSWNKALKTAGIDVNVSYDLTSDDCISSLKKFFEIYGVSPTSVDCNKYNILYDTKTYYKKMNVKTWAIDMSNYKREDFVNLRVRAYLQTGIISDQFLPLDGILYYHLVRQEMGEKIYSMPGESNIRECKLITLPILKSGPKGEAWFYASSFAQWSADMVEDETFYVKRFDLQLADYIDTSKKGKVELAKGRYKNYHVNVYYRHAQFIDWYCVGIPDAIENLLRFCTHLGKKTAQGWGSVLRWEVKEWAEDWSIRGPGNKLMRNVPTLGDGFLYGLRPSYWNERHIFPCKMP